MQSQWMAESELRRKISFFSDLYPTTADDEQHDEGLAASIKAFTTYSKNDGPITIPMTPTHIGLEGPKSLEFNVTSGVAVAMGLRGTSTRTAVDFIRNDVDSLVSSRPSTPQSCLVIKETPVVGHNKRQTGGLRQEAASSSVMPSSSRATLKRKKSDIVNQVAPNQRIFNDLCFFFIPNNDVSGPRRLRIRKAMEYGATWIQEWNSGVTHVVVDSGLALADVLRVLKISQIPDNVVLVKENYPAECIGFRLLLDARQKSYEITGTVKKHIAVHPGKVLNQSSANSLQLKPVKGERHLIEPETASRTEESSSGNESKIQSQQPTVKNASVPDAPSRSVYESCEQDVFEAEDPLQQMIVETRKTNHLLLESDDESSEQDLLSTATHEGISSDGGSSAAEERQKKKRKKKTKLAANPVAWQENFQCMQDGKSRVDNPNARTIEVLQEMVKYYESTQDHWRPIAYRKAIASLRNQPTRVTTKEDAEALLGVGARLAAKIEEIVWTNRLRRLDNAKVEPTDLALQLFLKIYGVGFSQASMWVQQGLKTTDDLLKHVKLSENQRIGIDHLEDFQVRIPRAEVAVHGEIVTRALLKLNPAFQVTVGGSYRRGAADSGDVDLVITRPDTSIACIRSAVLEVLVPELARQGYLTATLAATSRADGTKWHGACQLPTGYTNDDNIPRDSKYGNQHGHRPWRRIDFLLVPWDEMGAAMIYFTGDDIFNRSMRLLARKKGMRLNQRGLYKDIMRKGAEKLNEGTKIGGKDEKAIFKMLGVHWREPTARIC